MINTELVGLARWAEAELPRLIDEACAATVDGIPFYRDDHVVSTDELHRSVDRNMRSLVAALGDPDAAPDLVAAEETGRRRAHQGAPLPEVLQCYRICFAILWDELVAHTRRDRPLAADALLSAASTILQFTDQHAVALTEGFRAATAELLVTKQRRRSALVEALLVGQPIRDMGPWEAAALLGLPADGLLAVVVAETRGLAEESLPGIERRLAGHGIVSAWRLTPAQQLGVISLHGDRCGTVLDVLRAGVTARTGVSPPYRSLADTPRALHLAQAALAGIPDGRAEVRMFSSSPLAALVVCEPAEARRLTEQVLDPVLGLASEDRTTLLDTLYAYLEHSGSVDRAAKILYCHPNTVRYRIRRLQEITGRSFSDPQDIAELAAAAYALRLSSTALWSGHQRPTDLGRRRVAPDTYEEPTHRPSSQPAMRSH